MTLSGVPMLADDDFVEHEDVEPEDAEPEAPEELGEGSLGELLALPSQIPSALCPCVSLSLPWGWWVLSPHSGDPLFPTEPPEPGYEELVRRNVVGAAVGLWG